MSVDSSVCSGAGGYGLLVEVDAAHMAQARGERLYRASGEPLRRPGRVRAWLRRLVVMFARSAGGAP